MLEAYFLLLTLGTLAAFIVWEGIRNRRTSVKPLSRHPWKVGLFRVLKARSVSVPYLRPLQRCSVLSSLPSLSIRLSLVGARFSARSCTPGLEFGVSPYFAGCLHACSSREQLVHATNVWALGMQAKPLRSLSSLSWRFGAGLNRPV